MDSSHFLVQEIAFESAALRGNPLGDPHVRRIPVVLPRDWERGGPYPVLFVLAGYGGSARSFLNWKSWAPTLPERLEHLREAGEIGDLIVVFPDGFSKLGGSQYLNSPATGRYEDMLVDDLVGWVDERFPTHADRRYRAIAGKSSGGYASLVLGMRHPDVFNAVACHSGDMYFEYCYAHDFPKLLRQLDRFGDLESFMEAFFSAPKITSELFLAMNMVAMAAAYSPSPGQPWNVELPFDPKTGEIRSDIWARWLEHDPVRLCEEHSDSLKRLALLFLDCGSRDQFHLQYGLRILSERLDALGVPHTTEEFDDDHMDTAYRYEVSFPRIWSAIGAHETAP